MVSVAGTATGLPQSNQANEEYEMACEELPMPPGWSAPEGGDPQAVSADEICIRDIQLESHLDGYQRLAIWIDMPRERLVELASVQYYLGDEFEEHYVIPDWVSIHERYIQFFFVPSEFDIEAFVTLNDGTRIEIEQDMEFAEREPDIPADHYFLAHLLVKENRAQEAIALLDEYPDEVAAFQPAMTLLGLAHLRLGRRAEALSALRQGTEIAPEAAGAWGMLARVIMEDLPSPTPEEVAEALEAAQIAVDIRADPEYLDALGWAHHRVDQNDQALEILLDAKEAIMLVGEDHSTWEAIHYHLAEVYLAMEDFDQAKEEYENVVDFFDKYPGTNRRYVEASESRLEELRSRRR
jgi:tetratricopeptide (TPR) repeat protein